MMAIVMASINNPYEDIPYDIDFETLRRVQSMTGDIASLVLGIIAGYIIVVMFLITVTDICYMMIPPLQDIIRGKNWDGSVDTGSKFRLVSKDATSALRESCVGEKNCLAIYLRKRLKTYIIAAILLYITIGGSQIIVNIVISLLSGLLKMLNIV